MLADRSVNDARRERGRCCGDERSSVGRCSSLATADVARGGSGRSRRAARKGCTTIAAVLAVLAAQSNQPTLLLDTRSDAAPTLGVSDPPAPASTFADAIDTG